MKTKDKSFPIIESIKKRSSYRKYKPEILPEELLTRLHIFMDSLTPPPFGSTSRFVIVDADSSRMGRIPGTYGMIQGARKFFVGIIENGPWNMEDFGYQFERIILYSTSLDLGTCWMGASLKKGLFAEKAEISSNEIIAAISPVGFRPKRRGISDTAIRASIGASKRKPWNRLFFQRDFDTPLLPEQAGKWEIPLEMVRLGPSATNKQPWRIIQTDSSFHFFLKRQPGYNKLTKDTDMQRIDMGIAMCHFELSAGELGLKGKWNRLFPEIPLPGNTEYIISFDAEEKS